MSNRGGLSRRRFLGDGMAMAAAWELQRVARAAGFSPGSEVCPLAAEQEVGPYYVAEELVRSNIREGKPGVALSLRLIVLDARTCKPLPHAAVDVWHCDAVGLYAGFTKLNPSGFGPGGPPPPGFDPNRRGPRPGFDPSQPDPQHPDPQQPDPQHPDPQHPDPQHPDPQHPDPQHPGNRPGPPEGLGPPPAMKTTDKLTFLRGIQFTDERGRAEFATIFPGFYMGRTNHIHFKVREGGRVVARKNSETEAQTLIEGHTSHIGQVFFPEELSVTLMQREPYRTHQIHRTTQGEDGIFAQQHGAASVATLRPVRSATGDGGYAAEMIVAVDPGRTPVPVGMGPPPPRA